MKLPDSYRNAGIIGFLFVVIFYLVDFFYLDLSPVSRFGTGFFIIFSFGISALILRARQNKSSRVGAARNYGEVISHDDQSLSFVKDTTTFSWEAVPGGHRIGFYFQAKGEAFSICHQSWKSTPANLPLIVQLTAGNNQSDSFERSHPDCQIVRSSEISGDFKLLSKNPEFLQVLLKSPNVNNDLSGYYNNNFRITFDGSLFEMNWHTGSNEELEDFQRICQTALIFREELGLKHKTLRT